MKKGLVLAGLVTVAAVSLLSLSALAVKGSVNPADAAELLRCESSGSPGSRYNAALVLQYSVGLIDCLPTAEPTSVPTLSPPEPTITPEPTSTPEPTPSPHIHDWVMHEATGHYESRIVGSEEVEVGTYWEEIGGWDEERAAYYQCNDCGECFSTNLAASEHLISVYHSSYSYYPAESVHHNGEWIRCPRYETLDVYEDVWIVDSDACWSYSCGETRAFQP